MSTYIVIQEKLCQATGRFKTFVLVKHTPLLSTADNNKLKEFECRGSEQPFRHIQIDLESGRVTVMRPDVSEFPGRLKLFTHASDKYETTQIVESDA